MECIYLEKLEQNTKQIIIPDSELRHIKVLRLGVDEKILATNGRGIQAYISIENIYNKTYATNIQFINGLDRELKIKLGLAMGKLDNRDRFEFAFEKSIELGITDFYILNTEFSQKKEYTKERMLSKAIATLKQCKRSILPNIYYLGDIKDMQEYIEKYNTCILTSEDGEKIKVIQPQDTLIFIGPEGGFSKTEIDFFMNFKNMKKVNLGNRRLRSETAAILSVGLFSL